MRTGPGTNYGIIGSLSEGKEVTVIGTSGSWLVISYYGAPGFVSGTYFTSNAPSGQTSATQTSADTTQSVQSSDTPEQQTAAISEVTPQESSEDTTAQPINEDNPGVDDEDDKPAETTPSSEPEQTTSATTTAAGAGTTTGGNNGGGLTSLLIAIGCGVGTFLLLGVVPVVIHSVYHKKLYQY